MSAIQSLRPPVDRAALPRRAFRRYVRLDCQVVREHDFRVVADLALDLSEAGMLVSTRDRVLTGEEVVVCFKPPRSNRWVDAVGTVARVLHGRRPGDRGRCLGIEFFSMDEHDRRHLWESLRGLPAPDPMRDPVEGIVARLV
ncbi:MAG TPA: PilZ domain-containing protein, partial [Polyangiaceae bacterium]|nr:PilZ domain-containing protein [Polyangiaceae bacterium]